MPHNMVEVQQNLIEVLGKDKKFLDKQIKEQRSELACVDTLRFMLAGTLQELKKSRKECDAEGKFGDVATYQRAINAMKTELQKQTDRMFFLRQSLSFAGARRQEVKANIRAADAALEAHKVENANAAQA